MRMSTADISSQLAVDVKSLNALKHEARANTPASNKAVAQQFEALFLQTVMKSMRDATPRDDLFGSDQSRMFESMYDQQLTQLLATRGRGTGLAELIEKQLARLAGGEVKPLADLPFVSSAPPFPLATPSGDMKMDVNAAIKRVENSAVMATSSALASAAPATRSTVPSTPQAFVARIWPHALEASRATGIPAHFMVAQAALESAWGQSAARLPDGASSHNLFGIKAGKSWTGPVVTANTTEVVDGRTQQRVERFRAYATEAEAFRDYANLLSNAERYAGVLGARDAASFARGLQQAGYATDPLYAVKLAGVIGGSTLRGALPQA